MSNRNLVTYEENRLPDGPYWTLEVQRSAAGEPWLSRFKKRLDL